MFSANYSAEAEIHDQILNWPQSADSVEILLTIAQPLYNMHIALMS